MNPRSDIPASPTAQPLVKPASRPLVGVIMGSSNDWPTMKHTADALAAMGIPHECLVVSAHRTPDWLFEYASTAQARGLAVIVAGAGGAAHLPGMTAAKTLLPVIGVPVESSTLGGIDSLLSIMQMPAGIPVATVPIGVRGARSAGVLAGMIVAMAHPSYRQAVMQQRSHMLASSGDTP